MKAKTEKTISKQSKAVAGASSARQVKEKSDVQFEDRRPAVVAQRELAGKADSSPQAGRIAQLQAIADVSAAEAIQRQGLEEEEPLQGKFETIQKQEEEEELQMKSETIQRQGPEEEELLQGKFETIQKQPEEEELLQGKFETIQRQGAEEEEELLQGKFETIQKQEEEEELQMKSETIQRQGAEEEEELLQGKFETIQKQGSEEEEIQAKSVTVQKKEQKPANNTGLPDNLKSGIENLSGLSLDDVKVHYNSAKPAQLQAHAFAQGTDIHMAPGQEKHLPHEAWHVVQQKQGRVKPTRQLKGKVNVNDDAGLEKEADVMGERAIDVAISTSSVVQAKRSGGESVVQREETLEPALNEKTDAVRLAARKVIESKVTKAMSQLDAKIKEKRDEIEERKTKLSGKVLIRAMAKIYREIDKLRAGKVAVVIRGQKLAEENELFEKITQLGDISVVLAAGAGAPGGIDLLEENLGGVLNWEDLFGLAEILPGVNLVLSAGGTIESAVRGKRAHGREKVLASGDEQTQENVPTRAEAVLKSARGEQGREVKRRAVRGGAGLIQTGVIMAGLIIGTAATGGTLLLAIGGGIGVMKGLETAGNLLRKAWGKNTAEHLGQQLLFAVQYGDPKVEKILVALGIPTMRLDDPDIWQAASQKLRPIMKQAQEGLKLEKQKEENKDKEK